MRLARIRADLLHCVDITGECLGREHFLKQLLLFEKVISPLAGHRSTRRMTLLSLGSRPFHQAGVGQDPILQFKRSIKPTAAAGIVSDGSQRREEREGLHLLLLLIASL